MPVPAPLPAPAWPRTFRDGLGRAVVIPAAPQRVVVTAASVLDIVYALGGTAVGRPTTGARIPESARNLPEVGTAPNPNIERILALRPDLVIGVHIQAAHAPAFAAAGIPFFMTESATVERTLSTITDIGAMLDRQEEARNVVGQIAGVKGRLAATPRAHDPSVLIIWGAPGVFNFALPGSFVGDLVRRVGATNVAQDMASIPGQPTFANFSMERVLQHNPDFILIVAHGDASVVRRAFLTQMQNDPAWRALTAARDGRVHILPFDLFGANPGSRLGEALEHLASLLYDSQ